MAKRKGISRRRFVGDVTAGGLSFTIVPRHVLGRGYLAPSDKLNIGCVGGGGRAKDDIAGVSATENIYAIADTDWDNAGESFAKFPQARSTRTTGRCSTRRRASTLSWSPAPITATPLPP